MKYILSAIAFFFPFLVLAQAFPSLPKASEISVGSLPNGVEYYLVTNTAKKGFADFALVQKGNLDRAACRSHLSALSQFGNDKPYEILAKKGVGYGISGYAEYNPAGAVFRFSDVPVFDTAAADSTVLTVFALMQEYPKEQAVVVSGDINASKMLERMKTLSMLVPPRERVEGEPFRWEPTDSIVFECSETGAGNIAFVQATYFTKRIPRSDMSTIRPLVTGMFAEELNAVADHRLRKAFSESGIPLADLRTRYLGSDSPLNEERYEITVVTGRDYLVQASSKLGEVLSELDSLGVGEKEFAIVKDGLSRRTSLDRAVKMTNRRYVDKCVSAYLFGTSLSSDSAMASYMSSRRLPPESERRILGRFASTILSGKENVILHYGSPEIFLQRDSLVGAYEEGWKLGRTLKREWGFQVDSNRLVQAPAGKMKLKSIVSEPATGGSFWTFPNGMRVIYRKSPAKGEFRYSFVFKEGFSSIPGMTEEQARNMERLFGFYGLQGMDSERFSALLASNGVSMRASLTATDLRINGSAPASKLSFLLRTMMTLSSRRVFDRKAFEQYRSSLELLSDGEGVRGLDDSVPAMAEKIYSKAFGNYGNGFLILVGDLEEKAVQSMLCQYLNGFRIGEMSRTRPRMKHSLNYGVRVDRVKGDPSLELRFTADIPFSLNKVCALEVARMALQRELVKRMSDLGMSVRTESGFSLFPVETMHISVICVPCRNSGLPAGVEPSDMAVVRDAVEAALLSISAEGVSGAEMKGYKAAASSELADMSSDTEYIVEAAAFRYSYGKDIITGRKDAAESVTTDQVKEIASALAGGEKSVMESVR